MRKIMRKMLAIGMVLALVAMVFAMVPMNVSAEFTGNVTINADGSVDPSTAPVKVSGKNYKLTDDIYGTITIKKDDIKLDGKGYTLSGTGWGYGVNLNGRSSCTIKNLNVEKFFIGIYLNNVDHNTISKNTISECFSSYFRW